MPKARQAPMQKRPVCTGRFFWQHHAAVPPRASAPPHDIKRWADVIRSANIEIE
jgi:hypothetical protein